MSMEYYPTDQVICTKPPVNKSLWPRVSRCPRCGNHRCRVASDGKAGWCYRQGGLWVERKRPAQIQTHPITTSGTLAPKLLDRAYRDILAAFPLSGEHYRQLKCRGLSQEAIERAGYASLTLYGRLEVARRLISRYGPGIPGLYRRTEKTGRSQWSLTTPPGLLIPVRGFSDQIRALLVRLDRAGATGKYHWFSSASRPSGVSSGSPCHLARPVITSNPSVLWITEGPLKADILADITSSPVIGLPGTAWKNALPMIVSTCPCEIILAFDADKNFRPTIKRAEQELSRYLLSQGYKVLIAAWQRSIAKGIDDLLVADKPLILIAPDGSRCIYQLPPSRVKHLSTLERSSKRRSS